MLVPDVGAWAKLGAYVVCIGLALEFAHQIYWRINSRVKKAVGSAVCRAVLSTATASIPLGAVILITMAFCVYVDNRSMEWLGLARNPGSPVLFTTGLAIAAAAVTLLFVVGYGFGWFRVTRATIEKDRLPTFCGGTSDFFLAAAFEELAFRGYVFSLLYQTWGASVAVVGSAAIFSVFHLVKHPRMPIIFTVNAFFFGVVTAQARLLTGTLWAPIGIHFGWNLAMSPVFGLPCSGRNYEDGLVCSTVEGPEWVTGGLYSPDAGVLGTAALAVTTLVLMSFAPIQ